MSMFASPLPRRHPNRDAWAFGLLAALIALAPLLPFDAARAARPATGSLDELPARVTAAVLAPDEAGVPRWATGLGPHDAQIEARVAAIQAEADAEAAQAEAAMARFSRALLRHEPRLRRPHLHRTTAVCCTCSSR
ncbi:MAG: hypothetical protein H6739_33795 [Alphaproteobacteria bacterium]|nr:hypothetical protein [Alphaproteobacteria bacterium]